jgi:hypothetical protein
MGDGDGKAGLVGEPLQLELPQTDARAIAGLEQLKIENCCISMR